MNPSIFLFHMTPETNHVTSEHTCLVITCIKAAKTGTDDSVSQYSQLLYDSKQAIANTAYFWQGYQNSEPFFFDKQYLYSLWIHTKLL